MRSKLDETKDFVDLVEYVAGDWTTPGHFHRWSALALIAACVEDRVFMEFSATENTFPNIWVFLIGPSGTGKDHAIRNVLALLREEDTVPWLVDGKVTMPALYDYLYAKQKASGRSSAPLFLVSSDVTEQLPLGPEAKDFTSRVLALYDRQDRVLMDLTRTRGDVLIRRPMTTWIAGCTPDWFPQAIDPLVFNSGFSGRAFFIIGAPNLEFFTREHPTRRVDEGLVLEHLRQRVELYQGVEGLFVFTQNGETNYKLWLANTEHRLHTGSLTDIEKNVIGRMRVHVKKLAMLFCLSRWYGKGILAINERDVARAVEYAEIALVGVRQTSKFAYVTVDTAPRERIAEAIRVAGQTGIERAKLMRIAGARGVRSARHMDEIVEFLKQSGLIEVGHGRRSPRGRWPTVLRWVQRRLPMGEQPDPQPANEEDENGATEVSDEG